MAERSSEDEVPGDVPTGASGEGHAAKAGDDAVTREGGTGAARDEGGTGSREEGEGGSRDRGRDAARTGASGGPPDPRVERTYPDGFPPPPGPAHPPPAPGFGPPPGPPQGPPYGMGPPYPPPPLPDPLASLWPGPANKAAAPILLAGAVLGGIVAAAVLVTDEAGLNVLLVALAAAAGIAPAARRRMNRTAAVFAALTLALAAMAAVRDAEWIVGLCVALAFAVGSYALVGGRGWIELMFGGCSLPLAGVRMLPWAGRGAAAAARAGRGGTWRLTRALLVTAGLVLVFGGLLASADAAFSRLAEELVPDLDAGELFLRGFVFVAGAGATLAAGYLAVAPPRWRRLTPGPGRPVRMLEWALPLGALNALFLSFVTVQATVLLTDDKDALLRSTGLSYAQYARQGFFQLAFITVLVIGVIAVAVRKAPRESARDRTVVNVMLGLLCAFTLLIVGVALRRLGLYEQAFGFTRLRLWVHAFELWLGLVIVMIVAAGVWPKGRWLPRAVAATGAAGLVALGALNPDAMIAERNVERHARTGKIDTRYLSGLSADAVPATNRLPEPYRSCALESIADDLERSDPWYAVNLGRARARRTIEARPVAPPADSSVCLRISLSGN